MRQRNLAPFRKPTPRLKRAEINRRNSLHSTGPRSCAGKLASSRNSLKHGLASGEIIIRGEDPLAFEALLNALLDEHQPANETEARGKTEVGFVSQRAAASAPNDGFVSQKPGVQSVGRPLCASEEEFAPVPPSSIAAEAA